MQAKILRIHDRRCNSVSIDRAEIRDLRRLVLQQDRVIADLILDMRALQRSIAPPTWGFDPQDKGEYYE